MRILMLTQWFQPEPTFKGLPLAKELVARGHSVTVITGFPNYPGGSLYRGYRIRLLQRESIEGVQVIRVPLYPSHDSSAFKRVLNYLSFAVAAAILGPLVAGPTDVAYVYHPPGTIGLPATILRWLRGIPFVYDIQDLWPDTLAATGMVSSKAVLKIVGWWSRFVYRQAAHIVVLSPGFKRELLGRGVPEDRVSVIYNWADEVPPSVTIGREHSWTTKMQGRFNVVYAGNMGKAQALDRVLDAAKLLEETAPQVQFLFIGTGAELDSLRNYARAHEISTARFVPPVPRAEIGAVFTLADSLLVHLRDDLLFRITIPGKTQAYLAAGRPILMAVRGDAADLVSRADAGFCCLPENPQSIAGGVLKLLEMSPTSRAEMGARGQRMYRQEMQISVGVTRLEECLRAAANAPSGFRHDRRLAGGHK